ncbi:MAG: 3-oxoacyl-ACP reductase FabG [Kiritimatiellae bacterium]|nr:3-oxoacyl-ACP reductase FabG [Kiritimatiellia bacterium]MBR4946557.1 3-oxoacyl-ACP reductase FabG [Kiritimatiellia bacterium]MBR5587428.1 3-oxoacyl-ACP reductase FabG [Kiritimatiellia bacterium]
MKRILITGSSRGIGKAIALEAARQGYDPVIHYCGNRASAEATAEAVKALGGSGTLLQFDCANRAQTREAIEADIAANGCYYGVVCNAGIADDNPFPVLEEEQWDRVLRTDLDGFYNVLKPIVMPMISERIRGRIIALSSISGVVGNRGQVNYSAAKAGIIGASKALAIELAKRSITVNCIAPGIIDTEMIQGLPVDEVKKAIPMRRFGKAEEVAALACFLLSEQAGYITRQVISINGGMF